MCPLVLGTIRADELSREVSINRHRKSKVGHQRHHPLTLLPERYALDNDAWVLTLSAGPSSSSGLYLALGLGQIQARF